MQANVLKNSHFPSIPTPRDTALFLLTPSHEAPELAPEWDEDEDLTNVKYYSPTSD